MGGGLDRSLCSAQTVRDQRSSDSILMNGESGRELEETQQSSKAEGRTGKESVHIPCDDGIVTLGSLSDHEAVGAIEDLAIDESLEVDGDKAWYSCLLHQPCKLKKTEDLLKSKVKEGEEFVRVKYGDDIVGWDFLCLGNEARSAIEGYEAVRDLRSGGELAKSCHDDPVNAIKALGVAERCCDGKGYDECTEEILRARVEQANRIFRLTSANYVIERWDPVLGGYYERA
jgi:hypothetical protein